MDEKNKELVKYWLKSAEEDLKTAKSLFNSKRYHHSLFFCHLFVEKVLKAAVVKNTNESAPYNHNLVRLSELSGINFTKEQLDLLDEINSFNIEARYNDYKFQFQKKATKDYTQKYFKKTNNIYLWLKKQI